MSQDFTKRLYIKSYLNTPCRKSMPERMKMEAGQTSGGKRFSKTIVGPPLIKRRTGLGGEYQAIGVIPQWPRFQLRF